MINVKEQLHKLGYSYNKESDGTVTYTKELSGGTVRYIFVEFGKIRAFEINLQKDETKEVRVSRKIKRLLNIEKCVINTIVDRYRYI